MPSCTGDKESSGCWVCPKCPKRKTSLKCITVVQDVRGTPGSVECNSSCRFFTRHFANPGLLHKHLEDTHQ